VRTHARTLLPRTHTIRLVREWGKRGYVLLTRGALLRTIHAMTHRRPRRARSGGAGRDEHVHTYRKLQVARQLMWIRAKQRLGDDPNVHAAVVACAPPPSELS
jgi:hypothetical protein